MPMAFQGLRNCQETFRFPGRIQRFYRENTGKSHGREWSAIYLDSRAPILAFSGFLCHLRQTKVKCFCLVNIAVIWTAAFPTGGPLLSRGRHLLKSNCIRTWRFSGEGQLQLECGPLQTQHERRAAPGNPDLGQMPPLFYASMVITVYALKSIIG